MWDALFITFRELAEAGLIVAALGQVSSLKSRAQMLRAVSMGVLAGLTLSILQALAQATWAADQTLSAVLSIGCALAVFSVACGMVGSFSGIRRHVSGFAHHSLLSINRHWVVGGFVAFSCLREGFELTVGLKSIGMREGMSNVVWGGLLGLLLFGLAFEFWRRLRDHALLLVLYRLSSALLVVLAIRMLLAGIRDLVDARGLPIDHDYWLELLAPVLQGGAWHTPLTCLLMAPAILLLAKAWWHEVDVRAPR